MTETPFRIGLIGAGTVGGGVIQLLLERSALLAERAGVALELAGVADLDTERVKSLGVPAARVTTDFTGLVASDEIDCIVELVGGTGVAQRIVEAALAAGKPVVTANKALLAECGAPLFQAARAAQVPLLYEAAVCGAIPIIRALRDGFVADRLFSLLGIVNGTCNYILTQMLQEGQSYDEALTAAQALGYAEADPTFDVEGNDSAHKLALLSALGFGTVPAYPDIPVEGISQLHLEDVRMAADLGYVVKLLAVARPREKSLFLSVHPALLRRDHPLASVSGSLNAVCLTTDAAEDAMFCGRGAGALPTASAVLSDVVSLARAGGRPPYAWSPPENQRFHLGSFADYECRYFLRFNVRDEYGVLGHIATTLGQSRVSIASVVQHEGEGSALPVVLLTHRAREGDLRQAVAELEAADFCVGPAGVLRVED